MGRLLLSLVAAAAALFAIACASPGQPGPKTGEHESALTEEQCLYFDQNGTTQICHATGSARNPYVLLKVNEQACVEAHVGHGSDYIAVNDPTCQGLGCLPEDAPCDPLVPCCGGGVCTNGVCTNLCDGVVCAPSDSCHEAGVCNPQTGICSNPVKADGAQCDDGNSCTQSDVCTSGTCGGAAYSCPPPSEECKVAACNGDGTCSAANAPDGTSCCGPIPSDRCGAEFHGSCEAGTCTNFNACGDGFIELALGESCDDGNTAGGDGCDATCHVEPFETTAPVKISGDLACTTAVANAARKIAVDGSGTIYAVMRCGLTANVAVSTDRGQSFSAPLDLSSGLGTLNLGVSQVAVATGPSGVAYVAIMLTTGEVYLRTTQDKGATWSSGAFLGTAANTTAGLSLAAFNDDIYVGFRNPTGISVARNHNRGAGAFAITPVGMSVSFFDLVFDVRLGTLAVCADTPSFHVRTSSDGGISFAPEVNPPGLEFFSDWATGNGLIFVSGTGFFIDNSTLLYLIPSSAPSTSTFVAGLPSVSAAQTRSVAADDLGNAFVASQLNGGGVQLDRLATSAAAFDVPRSIDSAGGSPVAGPLPGGGGAAVVYTKGTEVWATIQAY
jgi:cysteine-rich repeat protein